MDIITSLLKTLSASLSPGQLTTVLSLLGAVLFFIAKALFKYRGAIAKFFTDDSAPTSVDKQTVAEIKARLDITAKSTEIEKSMEQVANFREFLTDHVKDVDEFKDKLVEFTLMRQEVEQHYQRVLSELNTLANRINLHEASEEAQFTQIAAAINKNQDFLQRLMIQVEKMDEALKGAILEFRTYHRELSADVRDLGKDIALVERSVQSQMNTSGAVKLRP